MSFHSAESVSYSSSAFRDGKIPDTAPKSFEQLAEMLKDTATARLLEISTKDPFALDRHKYTIWDEVIAKYAQENNITELLEKNGKTPIKFVKAEAMTKEVSGKRIITRVVYYLPFRVQIPFHGEQHFTSQLSWNYMGEIGPSTNELYAQLAHHPHHFQAPYFSGSSPVRITNTGNRVVGYPIDNVPYNRTWWQRRRLPRPSSTIYPEGVLGLHVTNHPEVAAENSLWQYIKVKVDLYNQWVAEKRKKKGALKTANATSTVGRVTK